MATVYFILFSLMKVFLTRRQFIKHFCRISGISILGLIYLSLTSRNSDNNKWDHECIGNGMCHKCSKFDICILPAAVSVRKERKRALC